MSRRTIVVVGGGIAGISCLEAIINQHNTDGTLVLITNSRIIKRVKNHDLNAPIDSFRSKLVTKPQTEWRWNFITQSQYNLSRRGR